MCTGRGRRRALIQPGLRRRRGVHAGDANLLPALEHRDRKRRRVQQPRDVSDAHRVSACQDACQRSVRRLVRPPRNHSIKGMRRRAHAQSGCAEQLVAARLSVNRP